MSLFTQMKSFALEKGYALLRKKGATCPACHEALVLPERMPSEGESLQCVECSWSGGVFDLIQNGSAHQELKEQPAKSKIIRREEADGSVRWMMPASKRPNFFWFFALFWLGITGTISVAMVIGEPTEGTSELALWGARLFMLPFWAVGLGVGYWGLRLSFMESIVAVNANEVLLLEKCFGKVKKKSAQRSELKRVDLSEAYRQNNSPVYALTLFGAQGKLLKFGTRLKEDEKRWLLGQLRDALGFGRAKRSVKVTGQSHDEAMPSCSQQNYAELEEISESSLKLTRVGYDGFRIVREYGVGVWLFLGAFAALVIALVMGNSGLKELGNLNEELSWFDIVSLVFTAIPLLMSLCAVAIAIGLLIAGKHYHGLVETYEFAEGYVSVRKGKKSERGKEVRYQCADFSEVECKNSGHVNDEPRYSVALVGQKRLKVHGFLKGEVSFLLEDWLSAWMRR